MSDGVRQPSEALDTAALAADGVTTPAAQWLVEAAMEWSLDYGVFEVNSLVGTLATVESEAVARVMELDARVIAAAQEMVRLGNQPGMDDDEWDGAMGELEAALGALENMALGREPRP